MTEELLIVPDEQTEPVEPTPIHPLYYVVLNAMHDPEMQVIHDEWLKHLHRHIMKEIAKRDAMSGVFTESNLVAHANRELELIGEDPEIVDATIRMCQIFSSLGHSGASAHFHRMMLNELLQFHNLGPLTDDPDEWMHHTAEVWPEPGGVWQNVRNGEAFSNDGGKTYRLNSDTSVLHKSRDHTKPHQDPNNPDDEPQKPEGD